MANKIKDILSDNSIASFSFRGINRSRREENSQAIYSSTPAELAEPNSIKDVLTDNSTTSLEFADSIFTRSTKGSAVIYSVSARPFIEIVNVEEINTTPPAVQQPGDLTSPITCYRSSVINKGVGFTSIQSLFDLFPTFIRIHAGIGNNHYSSQMFFTTPSGTGSNGSLNSDGGIELFCATNAAFDVYEDDDPPPTHTFYFVQDPLELWVKAEVGNNTKWSKGGTNSQYNDTPPNLDDRIYAKVSYNFLFDH